MATPYVSTQLPSAQAPVSTHPAPAPKAEVIEFFKASHALAEAQIAFDGSVWSCKSCGISNPIRAYVTHWTNCPAERVLDAWTAIKRKAAPHA